jgi:hypothetical protein
MTTNWTNSPYLFAPTLTAISALVLTACGGGTDSSPTESSAMAVPAAILGTSNNPFSAGSIEMMQASTKVTPRLHVAASEEIQELNKKAQETKTHSPDDSIVGTESTTQPETSGDTSAEVLAARRVTVVAKSFPGMPLESRLASEVAGRHGEMRWSDPQTWGGSIPANGAHIVIPAGKTVLLDTQTASLGSLRIQGTLRFDSRNVALTAGSIEVTGELLAGKEGAPYTNRAIITLTGAPTGTNDGVARGLQVLGGKLELYGVAPSPAWTKLNSHAEAGAKMFTLASTVNWEAGSVLAVGPTDFYGVSETERLTVAQNNGLTLITNEPISKFRWGRMQYMTANGLSLTPPAQDYIPPAAPAPTSLDQRAVVANLSRNIVIQGADDGAWHSSGFGAHLRIMDKNSKVMIDGVELRRVGQSGVNGRNPIQWHMLSYKPDGTEIGDATGHVVRNSSIWSSSNRCIVIHGTNGVTVKNNICQDIKGHAFYLHDGVERRNLIEGNLALMMRVPPSGKKLQMHEGEVYQGGPAGFWLTNPDNVVRQNHSGDSIGPGFWLAYAAKPVGQSANVPLKPRFMKLKVFEFNTAHTSKGPGMLLEWASVDNAGNVAPTQYAPTTSESDFDYSNGVRFQLKGITLFKNSDGAFRNRVTAPDYLEWTTADNVGTHFAGAGDDGRIARGLMIGTSLNNRTPVPMHWSGGSPTAFATYHSTFWLENNTVVNFPFIEGSAYSGMFQTDDYYLQPVDKGTVRNVNNRLVNSSFGLRVLPPAIDGQASANRHWTLAGALWDPSGLVGPKENFWVYDVPFLTAGTYCQWVEPAGKNGKSCAGQYYGVNQFQTDFDNSRYSFSAPIDVTRVNESGGVIGRWTVGDGMVSTKLGMMRHFAARPGGHYILRFPGKPLAKQFRMTVTNAYRSQDSFVMAVSFDGNKEPVGYAVAGWEFRREDPKTWAANDQLQRHVRRFSPAYSMAEVANSDGSKIWQDRANNLVWFKHQGGITHQNMNAAAATSDQELYRTYSVVIDAK